jgi:hypothetical protein
MSRDTVNGTRVSFLFVGFAEVSWFPVLPQFVKTEHSGNTNLAC